MKHDTSPTRSFARRLRLLASLLAATLFIAASCAEHKASSASAIPRQPMSEFLLGHWSTGQLEGQFGPSVNEMTFEQSGRFTAHVSTPFLAFDDSGTFEVRGDQLLLSGKTGTTSSTISISGQNLRVDQGDEKVFTFHRLSR
jgi:hypothetical protein